MKFRLNEWLEGHGWRRPYKALGRAFPSKARAVFDAERRRLALGAGLGSAAVLALLAENSKEADAQVPGTQGNAQQPFALVTNFGADPTGTNDSTNAFLAAERSLPSSGGVVFMPAGTYKIGSSGSGVAFQKTGTSLWGSGSGGGSGLSSITLVNATALGANSGPQKPVFSWPNDTYGASMRNFKIEMAQGTPQNIGDNSGIIGLYLTLAAQIVIDNVVITGGDHGLLQVSSSNVTLLNCLFQNQTSRCWWLLGCAFSCSYGSFFSNGYYNVHMRAQGQQPCYECHIYGGGIDESNQWSAFIEDADRCSISGNSIWTGSQGAVNLAGPGTNTTFGVRSFSLHNSKVQPYQPTGTYSSATIYVGSLAVGTKLIDIETNPNSNTPDIVDFGAGTQYIGVNGQSSVAIVPPTCTATLSGTIAAGDTLPFVFINASVTGFPHTTTYTVVASDTSLTVLAGHVAAAINADQALINAGASATSSGAVITIQQPGITALSTVVSCTPTHGGGGTEAVAFSNSGDLKSGVPTAAMFQAAPWPSYSSYGATSPVEITGTGKLPSGIPLGFMADVTDGRVYYLDQSGTPRYFTQT